MAQFKLHEADENFLNIPQDGCMLFAGVSGTETWIERDRDVVVRIVAKAVGVATADGGTLQVCIEIGPDSAKGLDGPAPAETPLRASQSVQVLVKAGQRLTLRAYPNASNAQVLRTVVWAGDMAPAHGSETPPASEASKPTGG